MSDITPVRVGRPKAKPRKPRHEGKGMHFTRLEPHMCMCLGDCCNSWETGCICRQCPCNNGGPDHDLARDLRSILLLRSILVHEEESA